MVSSGETKMVINWKCIFKGTSIVSGIISVIIPLYYRWINQPVYQENFYFYMLSVTILFFILSVYVSKEKK